MRSLGWIGAGGIGVRRGHSETITGIGARFSGLRALLVALAVLLTALAAALSSVAPAYAQSEGCDAINGGGLNYHGRVGGPPELGGGPSSALLTGSFAADEDLIFTYDGFGAASGSPAFGFLAPPHFDVSGDVIGAQGVNVTLSGTIGAPGPTAVAWQFNMVEVLQGSKVGLPLSAVAGGIQASKAWTLLPARMAAVPKSR